MQPEKLSSSHEYIICFNLSKPFKTYFQTSLLGIKIAQVLLLADLLQDLARRLPGDPLEAEQTNREPLGE